MTVITTLANGSQEKSHMTGVSQRTNMTLEVYIYGLWLDVNMVISHVVVFGCNYFLQSFQ